MGTVRLFLALFVMAALLLMGSTHSAAQEADEKVGGGTTTAPYGPTPLPPEGFGGQIGGATEQAISTLTLSSDSPSIFHDTLSAPLVVPDLGFNFDSIVITNPSKIADLNVAVAATHTWVGDLIFTLTHEDAGTMVTVISQPGAPATIFGCSGNDIDALLDDEATAPIEDECADATPTISGGFTPNNPLSAFDGESLAGTWTPDSWALIATIDFDTKSGLSPAPSPRLRVIATTDFPSISTGRPFLP